MKSNSGFELAQNDIKPLYEKVYDHLNDLIVNGELKPGDKLLSEKELENMFDVSKITVRRAIQELVYENKVVRIAGKGSFVLKPKIEPQPALSSFSENMIAQGYDPSCRDSRVSLIVPHAKICGYLQIGKHEKVLNIYRLMLANGMPISIQDTYLPAYIYNKNPQYFTAEIMNKISLYKILEMEFGITLFKAEEWVEASKATQEEADLLGIEPDDSILIVERITYTTEGDPIEYGKLIFPANRYRYKVELFRSQKNFKNFERR